MNEAGEFGRVLPVIRFLIKKLFSFQILFGPFIMPHLSPGFRELITTNIAHLQDKEYKAFFIF